MVRKRRFNEAESYGWVVEDYEAQEAYQFACDYFGKDALDSEIVDTLSNEELASSLAFIFRMNDFREWDQRNDENEDDDFEESVRRSRISHRKVSEAKTYGLEPQYDSRKSFYGKAHVVTDDDGTQILYSYNTPVVEIKDGKVKLLAMWDSSQTTLRHVKEFLQQNGFSAGSKAQIAKMYGGANESLRRSIRKYRRK
jgi:hypothetical protein